MKSFNYRNQCPICKSKIVGTVCPLKSCYKKYKYDVGGEFPDFYMGDYIIEYHLKEDDSFDYIDVIQRGKGNFLYRLHKPLDFSSPLADLISKLEGLSLFK